MQITLIINGEAKTFNQSFISGRAFRQSLAIQNILESGEILPETLDRVADYVVSVYGKQFTQDEFYDGIDCSQVVSSAIDCVMEITRRISASAEGGNPNGVNGAKK